MRILLCACLVLAGCSGRGDPMSTADDRPKSAAAEQAELKEVRDMAERGRKEVTRVIAEAAEAGIEDELQAAINRLTIANNERVGTEGQLSAAKWYEQQVTGKTPAQIIAAFPEK